MNKKEAIAYAQITLDYMQSSKYKGKINIETFAMEMKQAFKVYPRNLALHIAESKWDAKNRLETMLKDGDVNEWQFKRRIL